MIKEYIKKYEKSSIASSILMIVMAILLMLKPTAILNTIVTIFGLVILAQGIINLILYFIAGKEERVFSSALVEGILFTVVSILILANKEVMISIMPIIVGVWIIIKSIVKLQLSFNMKAMNEKNWVLILISSLITLIIGIIALVNPFEIMVTVTILTGGFLLGTGIIDLVESICIIRKLK